MSEPLWDGIREGCGTCEFGRRYKPDGQVLCRRQPPVMLVVGYSANNNNDQVEQYQPWMAESDWCGEYKRRGT